ncbi:hypothetical protein C3E97_027670 [Pseudomonas sp. MWU12-2115]|uniref:hypothetical protein n=1 Tax=unclassified Pseudomonas TaxID=196821 RepID=UPI000CD52C73|nr:hypothetical protein [Pseudomonas sp. MWU12-2020]RBB97498.1 hypothetical protein C3E97_027670 [Pseudomonas sp. MWU12-2115]
MHKDDLLKAQSKLTYRQLSELKTLIKSPLGYFGSCTNQTMNALKNRGLADIEWSVVPGSVYRKEKWVITELGKAVAEVRP